jgi:hypothetical protein
MNYRNVIKIVGVVVDKIAILMETVQCVELTNSRTTTRVSSYFANLVYLFYSKSCPEMY